MNRINSRLRPIINYKNRKKLINTEFSLIASNCNGGFILHDLGLRFNSPFVNLWIKPRDYIRMLRNLKGFLETPLQFVKEDGISHPVGEINGVRIYFQHYLSEEEAMEKWTSRKSRMNYDNLFVLFTDRDGCTYEDLIAFDNLPIKNKIVFTKKEYPDIKSSFYIKGFENQPEVGQCFEYMPHKLGYKYYDQFDYVGWFNSQNPI